VGSAVFVWLEGLNLTIGALRGSGRTPRPHLSTLWAVWVESLLLFVPRHVEASYDASTRTAYLMVREPYNVVIGRFPAPRTSHLMRAVCVVDAPIGASIQACEKRLFS